MLFTSTVVTAILASVLTVQAAPTATSAGTVPVITNGAAIAAGLKTEASVNDRLKKLLTDGNGNLLTGDALRQLTVFDYSQQKPAANANGGSILLATVDNWPILTDLSISNAISFVEPCGLNIPHLHPRANEVLTVVEGLLDTGMVQENGFNTEIETTLGKYQATVFPAGSIHYQQNPTCDPAVFVAALSNEDPGRSDIATSFFMLDSDVINAALGFPQTIGGGNIEDWRAHLPVNLAAGVDVCLQKCGLAANSTTSASSGVASSAVAASSTAAASASASA